MIDRVDQALGKKYPDTPEALVTEYKKVIGPFLAELRERFNNLRFQTGISIEESAAAIEAVDTTDFLPNSMMIDSATGDVYALEAGTPGAGDLQATPVGFFWSYQYTLA